MSEFDATKQLLATLIVEIPTDGLMKGKMVLWCKMSPDHPHKMALCIANNSWYEASLSSIGALLDEARRELAAAQSQ